MLFLRFLLIASAWGCSAAHQGSSRTTFIWRHSFGDCWAAKRRKAEVRPGRKRRAL